jgi:hypothetical protein
MNSRTKIKKVKDLAKLFERLIAQDHLYTEERIMEMKESLSAIKEQIAEMEQKNYKGFGK